MKVWNRPDIIAVINLRFLFIFHITDQRDEKENAAVEEEAEGAAEKQMTIFISIVNVTFVW